MTTRTGLLAVFGLSLTGPVASAQVVAESWKVVGPGASQISDFFGIDVALTEAFVVVGVSQADEVAENSGAVDVFDRASGAFRFRLTAEDGQRSDSMGEAVAASGRFAVAGSRDAAGVISGTGAAYVFDLTTGEQLHKLFAEEGSLNANFGWSVAISGRTVLVGEPRSEAGGQARGQAHVFDAETGEHVRTLKMPAGKTGRVFGRAVAVDGTIGLVSAVEFQAGPPLDVVYVFDVTTGGLLHTLSSPDDAVGDRFGQQAVALSGRYALIGVRYDDDAGSNSGSAYVFDLVTGRPLHKLTAGDAASTDFFGVSVAASGSMGVVGAFYSEGVGLNTGAAYVYDLRTGEQLYKLVASDGGEEDTFGYAVAITGTFAFVGAYSDTTNGVQHTGSAYAFELGQYCAGDYDRDGALGIADLNAFLAELETRGPFADLNIDGEWNNADINLFVRLFLAGCG